MEVQSLSEISFETPGFFFFSSSVLQQVRSGVFGKGRVFSSLLGLPVS